MEESGPHQATIGPHQVDDNLHQAESRGFQHSNLYDHGESAYTNHINRGQSRGKGMFPMRRTIETCNVKLINKRKNCAVHGDDIHHPTWSCPRRRQMMLLIDEDLELRLVKPFPTTRSTTIGVGIRARPTKV